MYQIEVEFVLNEEKIKTMTKLAIYETTEGKKELNISKYYKRDYIRYNLFKTAVAVTIAFLIMFGLYVLLNMETIMASINDIDFLLTAKQIGLIYLIFLAVYMLGAFLYYAIKYEKIKPGVIKYNHNLKHLTDLYDKEEKELNDKRTGRSLNFNDEDINNY